MKEIEDRAEHNLREQRRFLRDAALDGLDVTLYVSTLDDSPVGSREGLTWGVGYLPAASATAYDRKQNRVLLPGLDAAVPLSHVFAMQSVDKEGLRRTLVVLDTPAQQTAAAEMFNHPAVREMAGVTGGPFEVHEAHRDIVPSMRRAAFRVVRGGKS